MSPLLILEPARRRLLTLPAAWRDAALVLLVVVVQLWPFYSRSGPAGNPWHWWGYLVVVASALPLLWSRRAPMVALMTSLAATSCYDLAEHVPAQPIWYGGLVALYWVADRSGRRQRWAMLVVTVGGSLLIGSSETALRSGVLFVAAYAIGRASATSRAHTATLRERTARLEYERHVEAERAAERERARIARDMHDILSHAVAVMVIQAEAGPVVVRSSPERAEAAFDAISAAGREAMAQLRRILDVLRADEDPLAPQPALEDLPTLADQACGAGLTVTYAAVGEPQPVLPDIGIAAYRIVQEAVTNVVKHAGASRAAIRLDWQKRGILMIDIVDDGRSGTAAEGTEGGVAGPALPSGGNGLIGIRERAAACGGSAQAGPRADGPGFRVRVQLPLTPQRVSA
ncbi:histidine kinase [Streptomyces sp. B15]|uniref:sensor histidine kinase n=1 Tax=Streptomyces sp. B15 TaxID=1537797 RepID=UPI0027DC1259|nr:histidine kinase [Streptomyces sp. B15]